MSNLQPTFGRVLLRRDKRAKQGSILIPEEAQKRHAFTRCEILRLGPTADVNEIGGNPVNGLKIGDIVLIGRHAGDWLNKDGKPIAGSDDEEFYICQDEDILAVVEGA